MAYETRLRLISQSQSIENNTSTVVIAFDFRRTDTNYWGYNQNGTAYWYINCDGGTSGKKYFNFNWTISKNTWKEVGRYTFTVGHSATGTKSISCYGYINFGSGVNPGSLDKSDTFTLNTIPRATTPTLNPSTVTIGGTISISLPRASSSFTHTLYHDFYIGSWTQFASGVTTSSSLTIPTSWGSYMPSITHGNGRIRCVTYNGSTQIGEKIVNFYVDIPSSAVPTISSVSVTETVSGLAAKFGGFVQNKSIPKFTISASGVYGSTISSYRTVISGQTYTSNNFTIGIVRSSGTINYTVTVTDSRGRTASKTGSISVLAYSPPSISSFSVERANSSGASDDNGTYAHVSGVYSISSVNSKNTCTYKVDYKLASSSSWTTLFSGTGFTGNISQTKSITGGFLVTESYDFRLVISDYFTSSTLERHMGTAFTLMNWSNTGRGFGIGKVSEKDALEINMDIYDQFGTRIPNGLCSYGGSNQIDPDTTMESLILTNKNTPLSNRYFYIMTMFYSDKSATSNRAQFAIPYNTITTPSHRYYYGGAWTEWIASASQSNLQNLTILLNNSITNKVLWSGGWYMSQNQTANLSEPISEQPHGIVLVFNQYNNDSYELTNNSWHSFFVPKYSITIANGRYWDFWMGASNFGYISGKAISIYDDHLVGAAQNAQSGTANGITYANTSYVMRYVIGV